MDKKLLTIIKILCIFLIAFLFYLLLPGMKNLFSILIKILMPFIIGFIGAYILYPLVEKIASLKISYKASAVIIVLIFIIVFIFIGVLIIPHAIEQMNKLIENIPNYVENISKFLNTLAQKLNYLPDNLRPTSENVNNYLTKALTKFTSNIESLIENSTFYLLTILITPILIVYFLLDFKKIMSFIKSLLIKYDKENLYQLLSEINQTMRSYFNGVLAVMIVLSLLATLGFKIIGIQFPLLWGIVIGITNIIPYIGPYLGGIIVVGFTMTTSINKTISVLIVIIILQLIESNFITPNVHSKTTNTSPILVLLFISLFGKFFGIFGMIIAVPILSILQILFMKKINE